MVKKIALLLGIGVSVACWASAARAVELFTNFNNGMELGYRPLGYPEFPPVRFHSWQPQGWYIRHGVTRPSGDWKFGVPPSPPTVVPPPNVPQSNGARNDPIERDSAPAAGVASMPSDHEDVDWLRGKSFLPLETAN
ncbi:MAG TPA: hypothetical protein VHX65_00205 [Pirellulales bacterium]|jgi:hypothetical protein|nr:hypothetical protein [Pirellulales bacterium]